MISDEGIQLPKRQTMGSCGYDFYMPYDLTLKKGWFKRKWYMVDTGVRFTDEAVVGDLMRQGEPVEMTKWFMMVVPRSGLGTKYGFRMRNTMGIIDSDYRDTIKAMVSVDKTLHLKKGDRFMQGVIVPYLVFKDEVQPEKRREGGHGSTGVN